jgi:uncharacterized protein DUF4333
MSPLVRFCALLAPVLAAALLVAGCGDTVIDKTKSEEATQASLERSLRERVADVDCPSDQEVVPGETYSCTVRFSGGKEATANLKIRNKDADVQIVGLEATK